MEKQTEVQAPPSPNRNIEAYILAVLVVGIETGALYLIGRDILGEGVIALLYLIPIGWSTARWGQGPGIAAAVTAALAFDFFFIPPFYTFTVGSLEGWLILIIFSLVAAVLVGRIQAGFSKAKKREQEAIFLSELSNTLADAQTPQAIANILAEKLQRLYLADLVQVTLKQKDPNQNVISRFPTGIEPSEQPDRLLPILAPDEMLGEISIWGGRIPLPPVDDPFLKSFSSQGAHALKRVSASQSNPPQPLVGNEISNKIIGEG